MLHSGCLSSNSEKRKLIFDNLRKSSIGVNVHYIPVYHQPYYQKIGKYTGLANTEKFYQKIVTIPLCPAVTQEELNYVSQEISEMLSQCVK